VAPRVLDTDPCLTTSVAAATRGRELAVRALLAAGCVQQRVAELLDTSRRSVGRMVEADVTAALRDADVVAQARTCLADTASRGSTDEEREAAEAWLVHALRDDQQVAQFHQRISVRRPAATARVAIRAGTRHGGGTVKRPAATPATPGPPPAVFAHDQLDTLTRQQQRILHRSALIDYVLTAERQSGQTLTMGDALVELLADITEAACTIGTIPQTAGRGRLPNV
jgi:hypothetical protein